MKSVNALRILACLLAVAAMLWGAEVVRQALHTDDGGPPLGAMCMGFPAVVLLVAAGAVWPRAKKK